MPRFVIKDLAGNVLFDGEAETFAAAVKAALDADNNDYYGPTIDFSGHDLSGIPVVPCIDRSILGEIERGGTLFMPWWHGRHGQAGSKVVRCGTTHCRAGWAVALAGQPGWELEDRLGGVIDGAHAAGVLIYAASRPGQPTPDFFATTVEAMEDLRACAGVSA